MHIKLTANAEMEYRYVFLSLTILQHTDTSPGATKNKPPNIILQSKQLCIGPVNHTTVYCEAEACHSIACS